MSARPDTLVFVAGTGTGVGKTWWAAAVATELRTRGVAVAARKPVQSGEPGEPTDADTLSIATGEDPAAICPAARTYPLAWAPPMAAAELGRAPFTVAELAGEIAASWAAGTSVGFVEGAGGPRSPLAADGDNVDLARALAPDLVVLVADAGLGTINSVRLSAAALRGFPVVVALNRFGAEVLHERNHEHLVAVDGLDVVIRPTELAARLFTARPEDVPS